MIDKQIHKGEFRLRFLMTNDCDMKCPYCLNDFQKRGSTYIDPALVRMVLGDYNSFMYFTGLDPIISFSGGEPGLHPEFSGIMQHARNYGDFKIQLNTNGKVDEHDWNKNNIDIRYHIGPDGQGFDNRIRKGHKAVFVVTEGMSYDSLYAILRPFYDGGMEVKTFVDYYASEYFRTVAYPMMLEKLNKFFPVSGRHTGKQENRGKGCKGCEKNCVTLKALWIFPDGKCSPCPQCPQVSRRKYSRKRIMDAYKFHLISEPK